MTTQAAAQQRRIEEAQERHRRLENQRIEREEAAERQQREAQAARTNIRMWRRFGLTAEAMP